MALSAFLIIPILIILFVGLLAFVWSNYLRLPHDDHHHYDHPPTPASFIPGEFALLALLPKGSPDPARLEDELKQLLPAPSGNLQVRFLPERRIVFNSVTGWTFATVLGEVKGPNIGPAELITYVDQINRYIADQGFREQAFGNQQSSQRPGGDYPAKGSQPTTDQALLGSLLGGQAAARRIGPVRPSRTINPTARPLPLAASVNWLAGGAPHLGGTGGPGARPVAYVPSGQSGNQRISSAPPWQINLPQLVAQQISAANVANAQAVHVAVLDTAPAAAVLQAGASLNDLATSLLTPGRMEVVYSPLSAAAFPPDAVCIDHDYDMADHGLFAAGIIHSIVPAAKMKLIQVLNDNGVGTLESLLWGLQQVLTWRNSAPDTPLVVNCSLTLSMPQPFEEMIKHQSTAFPDVEGMTPAQVEAMANLLGDITAAFADLEGPNNDPNVLIIASAGNEGRGGAHPKPRYPAFYPQVVGVGALRDTVDPASYSSTADEPVSDGIATFGGDVDANGDAHPQFGMLGLYFGRLPGSAQSAGGLARWSGTSFAAPVISGTVAALYAAGVPGANLSSLLQRLPPTPQNTGVGEVFPVTQG